MVAITNTTSSSSMESAASQVNNLPTTPAAAAAVISEQPKPNTMLPLPNTNTAQPPTNTLDVQDGNDDDAVGQLRGGWITIGKHFNCCGLNCGFSKTF